MEDRFAENLFRLAFYDLAIHNGEGWFCNIYYNALFHLDLRTGDIRLEAILPVKDKNEYDAYSALAYYDGNLVIAPKNAEKILIYRIREKKIKEIEISLPDVLIDKQFNLFNFVKIYNGKAYLFPGRYSAIIKICLNTYKVEYINKWYVDLLKLTEKLDNNRIIFTDIMLNDNGICEMICWQADLIIRFDLNTEAYEFQIINNDGKGLSGFFSEKNILWYSNKDKSQIIRRENGKEKIIDLSGKGDVKFEGGFRILNGEEKIYAFPMYGDSVIQIDKNQEEFKIIKKLPMQPKEELRDMVVLKKSSLLLCKKICRKYAVFFSHYDGEILFFDLVNGIFYKINAILSNTDDRNIIKKFIAKKFWIDNMHFECSVEKVDMMIQLLMFKEEDNERKQFKNKFGHNIYCEIKKLVD